MSFHSEPISKGTVVRVGRYFQKGSIRPFVASASQGIFDWLIFDRSETPSKIRSAVKRSIHSGLDSDFCAAASILETFLEGSPSFLVDVQDHRLPADLLQSPLPSPVQPRTFICVGLNYSDHARESNMELPSRPLLFAKSANAVAGHNSEVSIPPSCDQPDFEAELAVVIGKRCRHVREHDAMNYVLGYTCANDISARNFQFADGQWYRGKSCDGFGPLGPWIVTKTEIPDHRNLNIRGRLNGEVMQNSSTRNLIFAVPELIEFISSSITLEPGDVIATGTPPGVGFARKPPIYLKDGDTFEVEIEGIGNLSNTIRGGNNG
ncbi:MAG TPA: fumarylacetoacetate hydrolase family protein [Terriglobales bacterium]|nr:fumarylacetoacetate hydrolase family protein [Terriglobales bacterium]